MCERGEKGGGQGGGGRVTAGSDQQVRFTPDLVLGELYAGTWIAGFKQCDHDVPPIRFATLHM